MFLTVVNSIERPHVPRHTGSVLGGDSPGHCQITQIDVRLFLKNIISAIATNSASFS